MALRQRKEKQQRRFGRSEGGMAAEIGLARDHGRQVEVEIGSQVVMNGMAKAKRESG